VSGPTPRDLAAGRVRPATFSGDNAEDAPTPSRMAAALAGDDEAGLPPETAQHLQDDALLALDEAGAVANRHQVKDRLAVAHVRALLAIAAALGDVATAIRSTRQEAHRAQQ